MEIRKRHVIACDEDMGWCEQLRREFQKENIELEEVESEQELEQYWNSKHKRIADLIIVSDLRIIRNICSRVDIPVILVDNVQDTGREWEALESGVSDYISREKGMDICMARIRRYLPKEDVYAMSNTKYENIYEELWQQKIWLDGREVYLTPKESVLMKQFLIEKGQILARTDLHTEMGMGQENKGSRSLDMLIAQLRKKLKDTSYEIVSVYGKGYRLEQKK